MTRVALLSIALAAVGADGTAQAPKVSSFAPADDLIAQVDYYLGRAEEALKSKGDYAEAQQARIEKDSHVLSALALLLAMHDQPHKLKGSSAALLAATQSLRADAANFDKTAAALGEVRRALAGESKDAAAVEWGQVAKVEPMMKSVSLVHNQLQRNAQPTALKRRAKQVAAQAATLAAVAQASTYDGRWAKTPAELDRWRSLCAEMRDASGEVNSAAHAEDAQRTRRALARLQANCNDCHRAFRVTLGNQPPRE